MSDKRRRFINVIKGINKKEADLETETTSKPEAIASPFILQCTCGSRDTVGMCEHKYPLLNGGWHVVKCPICEECLKFVLNTFK